MSLLAKKKTVRTYARQKRSLYDEKPPTKRRRVECALESDMIEQSIATAEVVNLLPFEPATESSEPPTSSPKTATAIWSDEAPRSSPPSSPIAKSSPPPSPVPKRRPMFSIFKKQVRPLSTPKQPLTERSHNAQPPQELPKTKKRMVQMQLDLASETRKSCKTCGMEYIPSNAEDAAMHKKFHSMNVGGVDFTKSTVERLRQHQVWSGGDGSFIAVIGRRDALALRKRTSAVLKVVNTELAAVPIEEEELWSQTSEVDQGNTPQTRTRKDERSVEKKGSAEAVDRFKTYLYIRGQKCIGLCLAERIWDAYTVLSQDEVATQDDASEQAQRVLSESESSSISIGVDASAAMLGISRIWTSNQHRKQGIATRLLECARANFLYGLTIEKESVAFSQPTESGGKLARKWFGRQDGWHVYID